MQSSAGRLLALLSLLQARPRWNAGELAERLEITERTVRRDVSRLRDLGYPVVAEAGRTGGYQLGGGGALPPLLLADDEAVAVAVGLRAAATGGLTGYEDAAVAALAKLEQVLPIRLREQVVALNATTVLVTGPAEVLVDPELLLLIAQACRRQELLHFAYRDGAGNETDRRVEPYRLVNAERRWYLVARDRDRDDWRTFRLDRMAAPLVPGHRFVRGDEPDAGAMVAAGLALATYRFQARVVLHVDLATAAREISPTVGTLEEADGRTLLRIAANELDWIARYLAGLPFDAEVLDPPQLRRALRALARRLREAHREPLSKSRQ